jgi:hypothetical protein
MARCGLPPFLPRVELSLRRHMQLVAWDVLRDLELEYGPLRPLDRVPLDCGPADESLLSDEPERGLVVADEVMLPFRAPRAGQKR